MEHLRRASAAVGICFTLAIGISHSARLQADTQNVDPMTEAVLLMQRADDVKETSLSEAVRLIDEARKTARRVRKSTDVRDETLRRALISRIESLRGSLRGSFRDLDAALKKARALALARKLVSAARVLDDLQRPIPTNDPLLPFQDLRDRLQQDTARAEQFVTNGRTLSEAGLMRDARDTFERAAGVDLEHADYHGLNAAAQERARQLKALQKQLESLLQSDHLTGARRALEAKRTLLPADEITYRFSAIESQISSREQRLKALLVAGNQALAANDSYGAQFAFGQAAALDRDQPLATLIAAAKRLQ